MSSFVKISATYLHSQTVRARELKFGEKVFLSHLTSHVSGVTCHESYVTCQMSCDKVVKPVSEGSVINRAYPVYFLYGLDNYLGFDNFLSWFSKTTILVLANQPTVNSGGVSIGGGGSLAVAVSDR